MTKHKVQQNTSTVSTSKALSGQRVKLWKWRVAYTVPLGEFWKWPKTRHNDLKKHTIRGFCGMDRPEVNDDLQTAAVNIEFRDMKGLLSDSFQDNVL